MGPSFKLKKARQEHVCSNCGVTIQPGEEYYCEERFLASLHRPLVKYCRDCYNPPGGNADSEKGIR